MKVNNHLIHLRWSISLNEDIFPSLDGSFAEDVHKHYPKNGKGYQ